VIVVLVVIPLALCAAWLMRRASRDGQATPSDSSPLGIVSATALEDDPRWTAGTGSPWTALDERQLIRLLTDSAP
jgi:hypothetical protein